MAPLGFVRRGQVSGADYLPMTILTNEQRLRSVWNQTALPVALRHNEKGGELHVRLPYSAGNKEWLRDGRRAAPKWVADKKYWKLPKAWFDDFVNRALVRYGKVYIIQPYREQEKCSPACQNARGHECECSCMGQNHGTGNDGSWFEVSDTFSTRWGERKLACRLVTQTG
jgi:hypothetical protein